jgi:hypothetical protein
MAAVAALPCFTALKSNSATWWLGGVRSSNALTISWLPDNYGISTMIWKANTTMSAYTNWKTGEPSDTNGVEDCIHLDGTSPGTWQDAACSTVKRSMVEMNHGVCLISL